MCKQIFTPEFSVISTWLKCTLYLDKFSAISLVFFSFLAEIRGYLFRHPCRLLVLCVVVATYGANNDDGVVGLTKYSHQLYWDIYITEMYMIFCTFFLFCLDKFFTKYHYSTLSLFSLKERGRRYDGYFVGGGTVSCHDDMRCNWLWQA